MCIRILLIVSICGQLHADHSTRPIAALTRDLRTGRLDMLLTAEGHSLIWVGGYRTLGSPIEIVAYKHPS